MEQIWQEVKAELSRRIPQHTYQMWIEPLELKTIDAGALELVCPNQFSRKRILDNYRDIIQSEINRITGRSCDLEIKVASGQHPGDGPAPPQQMVLPAVAIQPKYGRFLRQELPSISLSSERTTISPTQQRCHWLREPIHSRAPFSCYPRPGWARAICRRPSGIISSGKIRPIEFTT
jgi:chromosomal replication initiation ATPase DnaA